ncbi:hypothetical protein CAPTEDRAFT_210729 [Capitella teleta]|uniref:Uncharacterized protein n=1 Tax=Capitella teleta TaxID=283909 RepID=R7TM03_CAPTE|nr:hypothetical protein CAPTEDRAFT_210729 [Capitella teleta]|eukprot:ELT94833.1 hypothetical protein CAPTEDRAFT_210729 [Capitella teleta]
MLSHDLLVDNCFENMALTSRHAYGRRELAKRCRQEKSRLMSLEKRQVQEGDAISVDCLEPATMSHLRDHAFKVVSVCGKVIGYVASFSHKPDQVHYENINRAENLRLWTLLLLPFVDATKNNNDDDKRENVLKDLEIHLLSQEN